MDSFHDWRTRGKCSTLSAEKAEALFFPSNGRSINKAIKFCGQCSEENTCLEFALTHDVKGIWAGTTEKDRKRLIKFREQLNSPAVTNPRKTHKKIKRRTNFTLT